MATITEQQFVDIYKEYAPKIFKYCYFRVNNREDAEDIASKVFTKAWDYIVAGKEIKDTNAFLYRIAHNAVVDIYGARSKQQEKEFSLDAYEDDTIDIPEDPTFVDDIETKKMVAQVHNKLASLPDSYREVIVLRFINDLELHEIAEVTGLSDSNVRVRIHRGIEKLKTLIS